MKLLGYKLSLRLTPQKPRFPELELISRFLEAAAKYSEESGQRELDPPDHMNEPWR